jgi:hypothetical protein
MNRLPLSVVTGTLLAALGCSKPTSVVSPALPPPAALAPVVTTPINADYQRAISDLEKRGALVQVLGEESDKPQVMVSFPKTQATDADMEILRNLRASSLYLNKSKVTEAGLADLKAMTTLTVLTLDGTPVTDGGLKQLENLTELRTLHFGEQHVSDAGMEHLKGMTALNSLKLSSDQVTDKGLIYLRSFHRLSSLVIDGPKITDAGLENLKGLTELRFLGVSSPLITDKGLENLEGLKYLSELVLSGCSNVTDAGLAHLEGLPRLRNLYLRNCGKITDTAVAHFTKLGDPETFDLAGTSMTAEGIKKLQQELPTVRINR